MTLDFAIKKAGSINRLARLLQVSRQAIQSYRKHGLPEARVAELREIFKAGGHKQ